MDSNEDLKDAMMKSDRKRLRKLDLMVAWMAAALARTTPAKMDAVSWAEVAHDYATDKMEREERKAKSDD